MKIDIARQPLVPAFMTLFALAVAAMCAGIPVSDTSGAVRDALPLLGGQLARFQAAYPVWSKFAAGFMLLFTGMCAGRITIRYNLYTVGTCLPIPLYAIVACGIATGGNYLAGFAASMLLALATKNYCRAFCNGYGFDAIFRASLYLGLMPLVYAPALPLLLLLPLAVLLFRRTFREVVVATAGLLLPIFTACYVSWGSGAEFTAPLVTVGQSAIEGMPLQLFLDIPLPALVMAGGIVLLDLTALFFFLADIYAAGTKPRFILFYNIGILVLALTLLCSPAATPEAFALLAVPSAILIPVFFVRIHRGMALPVWSWVEKMLQLAHRTEAPRAVSVSMSTAVCTVMCREPMMRTPSRGREAAYFSRTAIRPGISCSAMSSSLRPKSARLMSRTL